MQQPKFKIWDRVKVKQTGSIYTVNKIYYSSFFKSYCYAKNIGIDEKDYCESELELCNNSPNTIELNIYLSGLKAEYYLGSSPNSIQDIKLRNLRIENGKIMGELND